MDLYEIVMKLNGPIRPVGETNADNVRFQNLTEIKNLAERLILEIDEIVPDKDRPEYSMKRAGESAQAFFDDNATYFDR